MGNTLSYLYGVYLGVLRSHGEKGVKVRCDDDGRGEDEDSAMILEAVVATVDEISDGQYGKVDWIVMMIVWGFEVINLILTWSICGGNRVKEVEFGGGKILLCRNNLGEISAIGSKCPHYNAPLRNAAFYPKLNSIRCQLHGACFSTKTGDIEDCPSRFELPVFDVFVKDSHIHVRGNVEEAKSSKKICKFAHFERENPITFVIVGGGIAAAACADTLRKAKFTGRIVVLSSESYLTYDRTKISKFMSIKPQDILIYPQSHWDELEVEWRLNCQVIEFDARERRIRLASGEEMGYDKALIATGGDPNCVMDTDFMSAENVFLLRKIEDSNRIIELIRGKKVVIIGSSFVGMEVASCMVGDTSGVTVVGRSRIPYEEVLGLELGEMIRALHEVKGVLFEMQSEVVRYVREGTKIVQIFLSNGKCLFMDFIVVGVGIRPATSFISGVELLKDGSLLVDEMMRVKDADGLYAAGDVVIFPLNALNGDLCRVGHWNMAMHQGMVAAWNMVGISRQFRAIPYFWSSMYGKTLRYCGHAHKYNRIFVDKNQNFSDDPEKISFVAYYARDEKVVAVASIARDPVVSICAQLMKLDSMPTLSQIESFSRENGTADSSLVKLIRSN